ncbi:COG4315 family predicted lipoprotein [Allorhizobium pseudoryzae]|uniref:COG4315 family predicted lipoprotein n=1 Tax=Allorhizobium pseudoryzae TaxID=379684 RepID=UPI003D079CB5
MTSLRRLAAMAVLCASATAALAAGAPIKTVDTAKGKVLAGDNGMTLYTFRKDMKGVSNCEDKCAANWPPLMAAAGAKDEGGYSVITRKDGSKQWAKDGMPLYFWIKDTKAGDVTGDGVNGVWDLAKP